MTTRRVKKFKINVTIGVVFILAAVLIFKLSGLALANVPVEVKNGILDYVNSIKDISDTDKNADIQSYISGNFNADANDPNNVKNVNVTQTQKIVDSETNVSEMLGKEGVVAKNIQTRINELQAQYDVTTDATLKAKIKQSMDDLKAAKDRLSGLNFQNTIALDVNIVKNSAQTIEDLKDIAKEELARKEVGTLTQEVMNQYNQAGIISNWGNYLYNEPGIAANNYLEQKFGASSTDMYLPLMSVATSTAIQAQIKKLTSSNLSPVYLNMPTPDKKAFTATDINSVNSGTWSDLFRLAAPQNNWQGQLLLAQDAASEVASQKYNEQAIQAVSGGGVLPVREPMAGLAPDGSPNYKIVVPGSVVKGKVDAVTQAAFDLRANPKFAPPEAAQSAPGGIANNLIQSKTYEDTVKINGSPDPIVKSKTTSGTGLAPISLDAANAGNSFANINWWDSSFNKVISGVAGFDVCGNINAIYTTNVCPNRTSLKSLCSQMANDADLTKTITNYGYSASTLCGLVPGLSKYFGLGSIFNYFDDIKTDIKNLF